MYRQDQGVIGKTKETRMKVIFCWIKTSSKKQLPAAVCVGVQNSGSRHPYIVEPQKIMF
jgi:hypothetical protein